MGGRPWAGAEAPEAWNRPGSLLRVRPRLATVQPLAICDDRGVDVLWHPATLRHLSPPGFPEVPRRVSVLVEGLARLGHRVEEAPLDLERARRVAEAVHGPAYVGRLERAVARGDSLLDSPDNPLMAATFEAALAAAAVAIAATDRALADHPAPCFAAIRPPGHHAERETAMGFCYLANAAIAAFAAREAGLQRIAVVDFDVHHGNGTQHLFEDDPELLFVSLHQFPFYPGTGAADERGRGAGIGATLNVPLPAGTTGPLLLAAFDRLVAPALEAHRAQLVLVSAGFDAWQGDPLGGFELDAPAFAALGQRLGTASRQCQGRLVALLEGGYDVEALAELADAFLGGVVAGSR